MWSLPKVGLAVAVSLATGPAVLPEFRDRPNLQEGVSAKNLVSTWIFSAERCLLDHAAIARLHE